MRAITIAVILMFAGRARAHDVRGEVAMLDIGERVVDVELTVPQLQLALARGESIERLSAELAPTDPAPPVVARAASGLAADARTRVSLRGRDGAAFAVEVRGVRLAANDVIFALRFTPQAGDSTHWFAMSDELVLRTVVNGNVYVFVRRDLQSGVLGDSPVLAGNLHYQQRELIVDRTAGSWRSSLAAAFSLGARHIRTGADHLMFLLTLLIVAPLLAARRRWSTAAAPRRGLIRTASIATAFTVGHSLTLALGALGGLTLPARFVETAIATSILVSAIHAWRPLFAGREPWIAAGFGLIHGLAFATALAGFGFDRPSLALALVGFNLGVEAMQLAVIAVTVPVLLVLARYRGYRGLRLVAAAVAAGASLIWIAERLFGATLIS